MANSDDEDAFLYGSDSEQPPAKRQKVALPEKQEPKQESPAEDQQEESEEELSDDDIEFVIGESAPKISTVSTTSGPLNDTVGEVNDEDTETDEEKKKPKLDLLKLDINSVAEYEGKPLTQLDLEELKNKPWRAPGADISDYFNYGFDELTWSAYCHKQDRLRGEFNPQKILAKIMGGNMMPPMPNMPFPFPNMPQFPTMPGNMGNMAGNKGKSGGMGNQQMGNARKPPSMPKGRRK